MEDADKQIPDNKFKIGDIVYIQGGGIHLITSMYYIDNDRTDKITAALELMSGVKTPYGWVYNGQFTEEQMELQSSEHLAAFVNKNLL